MDRRKFMTGAAGSAVLLAAPGFAQEAFPSHAITIINAFPPGGANDAVTRPLASALEPILRQPVVVCTCTDDPDHKWRPAQLNDPGKCNLDGYKVNCK